LANLTAKLEEQIERTTVKLTQKLHLRPASGGLDAEWMPGVIRPYLISLVQPQVSRAKLLETQVREQKKQITIYEKLFRTILPKLSIDGATSTDLGRVKKQIHKLVETERKQTQ